MLAQDFADCCIVDHCGCGVLLLHRFNAMDLISANASANSGHLTCRSCDTLPFLHQESPSGG